MFVIWAQKYASIAEAEFYNFHKKYKPLPNWRIKQFDQNFCNRMERLGENQKYQEYRFYLWIHWAVISNKTSGSCMLLNNKSQLQWSSAIYS